MRQRGIHPSEHRAGRLAGGLREPEAPRNWIVTGERALKSPLSGAFDLVGFLLLAGLVWLDAGELCQGIG